MNRANGKFLGCPVLPDKGKKDTMKKSMVSE